MVFEKIKRVFKHRWTNEAGAHISTAMVERLMQRVSTSEMQHTGEIRICIEAGLPNSYLLRNETIQALTRQRAVTLFGKLRVWDTEHNNGVLIYLLLAEQAIELVADRGLNQKVSPDIWQGIVHRLANALSKGKVDAALMQSLEEVSNVLRQHFPLATGLTRRNELPNEPALL